MRLIHLNWNNNQGEGNVTYTKAFNEAHVVVQLDMLSDCIADLTDRYNEILIEGRVPKTKVKNDEADCSHN